MNANIIAIIIAGLAVSSIAAKFEENEKLKAKFLKKYREILSEEKYKDDFRSKHFQKSKHSNWKAKLSDKINSIFTPSYSNNKFRSAYGKRAYQNSNQFCALTYIPKYTEVKVTNYAYDVPTVTVPYNFTHWNTVLVSKTHTLTVLETRTSYIHPRYPVIIETKVIPDVTTVTNLKKAKVFSTISRSELNPTTLTVTSVSTQTRVKADYTTMYELKTIWVASTVTLLNTDTKWESKIAWVTQPYSVTTDLLVSAPNLVLLTVTTTKLHAMTSTVLTTSIYTSYACESKKYY